VVRGQEVRDRYRRGGMPERRRRRLEVLEMLRGRKVADCRGERLEDPILRDDVRRRDRRCTGPYSLISKGLTSLVFCENRSATEQSNIRNG